MLSRRERRNLCRSSARIFAIPPGSRATPMLQCDWAPLGRRSAPPERNSFVFHFVKANKQPTTSTAKIGFANAAAQRPTPNQKRRSQHNTQRHRCAPKAPLASNTRQAKRESERDRSTEVQQRAAFHTSAFRRAAVLRQEWRQKSAHASGRRRFDGRARQACPHITRAQLLRRRGAAGRCWGDVRRLQRK